MNRLAFFAALLVALASLCAAADPPRRWSEEQAWEWYRGREWLVGFNYVPSTACNTTEWWQKGTFDPDTIDRELGWAAKLGFNTTRAFLQYIVWRDDPEGFRQRFGRFLEIAAKHGIAVMPVLFDDCAFGDPPQRVGCYSWGLVNGRTQCQFAWFHKRGTPEPKVWFHDLFHADGRAYDQKEHAAIRTQTANRKLEFGSIDFRYMQSPAQAALTEGKGFRFAGEWTRWTGEGPLGQELFYCSRAGATAVIEVEGERVMLIHKAGPDCGIAEVRIDGRPAIRLDTYSGEVEWNRRTVVGEKLPAGRHRVTITVTGERSFRSSNGYIQLVGVEAR